jgi:acyl carrier protein
MINSDSKYQFLIDYFVEREGMQIIEKLFVTDLVESGLIDSLDILEIAMLIEENLNVKLNLSDDKVFKAMRNLNSIINLIEKC